MAKGKPGKRKGTGEGKHKQTIQNEGPSKRGRKTTKQVLENKSDFYEVGNPAHIRNTIHGWERESNYDDEDIKQQEETMDFLCDPGNTRGRVSLFHQYVNTYWKLKCVLAKAMTNMQETEGNPTVVSELQQIKHEIRDIAMSQFHVAARIRRIECQLQRMQQVEMSESTAKDPAPIDSFDG